jgi:hypothetical protein
VTLNTEYPRVAGEHRVDTETGTRSSGIWSKADIDQFRRSGDILDRIQFNRSLAIWNHHSSLNPMAEMMLKRGTIAWYVGVNFEFRAILRNAR